MPLTALSLDNAMHLASEAFLPYGCIASANPEDDSFSLTVMNGAGEAVLRLPDLTHGHYANPDRLAQALCRAREELERQGCMLDPWTMPVLSSDSAVASPPD